MKLISQDEERPLCNDEICSIAAIGLSEAEYRGIKGTTGVVAGLHLDRLAFFKVKGICKKHPKPQELILRYARARLQKKKKLSPAI